MVPQASSIGITGNLLEMLTLGPHASPTESETLENGAQQSVFQ